METHRDWAGGFHWGDGDINPKGIGSSKRHHSVKGKPLFCSSNQRIMTTKVISRLTQDHLGILVLDRIRQRTQPSRLELSQQDLCLGVEPGRVIENNETLIRIIAETKIIARVETLTSRDINMV